MDQFILSISCFLLVPVVRQWWLLGPGAVWAVGYVLIQLFPDTAAPIFGGSLATAGFAIVLLVGPFRLTRILSDAVRSRY